FPGGAVQQPSLGPGDGRLIAMGQAIPEDPDILLVVRHDIVCVDMRSPRSIPERSYNLVRRSELDALHPLDGPAQKRVVVSAVGGRLLASHEPRRRMWIEGVRVASQIGEH